MSAKDQDEKDVLSFLGQLQSEVNYDFLTDLDNMLDEHFANEQ